MAGAWWLALDFELVRVLWTQQEGNSTKGKSGKLCVYSCSSVITQQLFPTPVNILYSSALDFVFPSHGLNKTHSVSLE